VLGHDRAGLIGTPLVELLHPDDPRVLPGAPAGGADTEEEGDRGDVVVRARARHVEGDWRWVEWTTRVDAGRGLVFVAGRDLTERRTADVVVRAGQARLRALLEHSASPMFVVDLHGRYQLVNGGWARLAGLDAERLVGGTDAQCQPANAECLSALRSEVVDRSSSMTRDLCLETPDGPRDLLVTEFLLRDDSGEAYAVGGIATDITDRKRVAASLAERERVLATVLDASPDVISLLDRHGRIERVSAAETAILGHRDVDPVGVDLFHLVHPDDFDEVASAFIQMVTGAIRQVHVRYRVQDWQGRWVTMDSRGQAIVDDTGAFLGAVVVSRDVTARLESGQKLRALRQDAEKASRAKSEFLSRMSHELRTPLNSILGFSQLLQMDDLPIAQADAVEHIMRGGQHLLDLINEVLDIARIETGHLELSLRPVLVWDVVSDAVDLIRPAAHRADIAVRIAAEPGDAAAVLADRQRLLQVLLNLVSNAVKYNRPGGRVDISYTSAPGGRLRLAVADTGRGIRPDDMGRVFEPFDRLGAEQSGVEGTGVGLSLSRNLVEKMGGSLEVESVPDVGSTFFVELPVAVVADPAHRERSAAGGVAVSTFRVLLVEPNLPSLELVERVLARRPGVVVLGAMQGRLALELAREHHPDLVLLDLHLPDMPAAALLERLGEDPTTAGLPVAVLNSNETTHQMRRLLGRGVAGQLSKPIDVRALLSLVDAVRAASGR
jgi:PAS domain S-box-containing protein